MVDVVESEERPVTGSLGADAKPAVAALRAIRALAELRDPQTEAILTAILETRFDHTTPDPNLFGAFDGYDSTLWNADVSIAAAEALGRLRAGTAILRRHADAPKSPVRAEAAQALAAMGK